MYNPKVDKLIDIWYNNKEDIYHLFGDQLVIESDTPVEIEMSEDEIFKRVDEFITKVREHYDYDGLVDFIVDHRYCFCDNIVPENWSYEDIDIPRGMKITKAFKFFINDKEELDKVQTMASRIIQEKKVTGYLGISIHPLDYLSSAESTYNWRSCHALDGEHRAGNLSYMLDKSTIVCYLRGEKETKLPHFPESVPWNSKKWRMLLFLSDNWDAMFAGRHYPFFSKSLMIKVKKMLLPYFREQYRINDNYYWGAPMWSKWHNDSMVVVHFKVNEEDDFSLNDRYVFVNGIYPMKKLISDVPKSLHFNDLLYSSIYVEPYYCWLETGPHRRGYIDIHFTIGHPVPCLSCENEYISDPSMMVCNNCDSTTYLTCEYCGDRIPEDEAIWMEDREMYVCRNCYEELREDW